jgi:hypothetical protein
MGPVRQTLSGGIRRMPSFSVLWNEGFLFGLLQNAGRVRTSQPFYASRFNVSTKDFLPLWSLNQKPFRKNFAAQNKLKDQP